MYQGGGMKNLAIIPARGGSKRIPRKNIKNFLGKPIISYSIEAAVNSGLFDEIMVSTDDVEVAEIAVEYGAKIPFMRSEENSGDYAGLSDVCIEVVETYEGNGKNFDFICCILATAPLIDFKKIIKGKDLLENKGYDCVLPVTEHGYPIQRSLKINNGFVEMEWPENYAKRTQDLEKFYHDAGQFYFIRTASILMEKRLFLKKTGFIILNKFEVQDIDTDADWEMAETKYKIIKNLGGEGL
jgi:pseudaminic acid cytidylyltransferase